MLTAKAMYKIMTANYTGITISELEKIELAILKAILDSQNKIVTELEWHWSEWWSRMEKEKRDEFLIKIQTKGYCVEEIDNTKAIISWEPQLGEMKP